MHLLYLDESGSVDDPNLDYFVLAGVAVFERTTHWVEQPLNTIAERFSPSSPHDIELHGSPMRSGREGWKSHALPDRLQAIKDSLQAGIADHYPKGVRVFAAVISKNASSGIDPVEHVFEQIVSRFDLFLRRQYSKYDNPQRGMILLDKSSTERRIQTMAREFKYAGHTWGKTKNYAEVPVFLDSKASRLIQLADLTAYAIFRHYQAQDDSFYSIIQHCFDSEGGVTHGLYEKLS